eukprot:531125-Rhodomonas_salina.2
MEQAQQVAAMRYLERQRQSYNMNPLQQQAQARAMQAQPQHQPSAAMLAGNLSPRHQGMVRARRASCQCWCAC